MSTIQVDIVTPDGKVYDDEVNMVTARTTAGEIGVLPRHMPLVSPLKIGIVRLKRGDTVEHAAVAGGFIEVTPNHVTILAEAAELKEHIDLDRASRAKKRAEEQIEQFDHTHKNYHQARDDLERALNRIHAAKDR